MGSRAHQKDLYRRHFANVLYEMCETQAIEDITVRALSERAGTARQTFYNYFADINDLVFYASMLPVYDTGHGDRIDRIKESWDRAQKHRAFFVQLPRQTCQNNFRDSFFAWIYEIVLEALRVQRHPNDSPRLTESMAAFYAAGSTEILIRWLQNGMDEQAEIEMATYQACYPAALFERTVSESDSTPSAH